MSGTGESRLAGDRVTAVANRYILRFPNFFFVVLRRAFSILFVQYLGATGGIEPVT